jgi:SAM-dependent methyltransferase
MPPTDEGPDEDVIAVNRAVWTEANARYTDARAIAGWQEPDITWGVWHVPETQVRVLPASLADLDVVELGCGTAYLSAWLARRGARPVGVDPTPAQLATARRCQSELGLPFPLVEAPAAQVPLPDAAFDLAVSEYGASIWADPYRWIPEAARLLRPGGRLVFLRTSTLVVLCSPDTGPAGDRLVRPQFGLHRLVLLQPSGRYSPRPLTGRTGAGDAVHSVQGHIYAAGRAHTVRRAALALRWLRPPVHGALGQRLLQTQVRR